MISNLVGSARAKLEQQEANEKRKNWRKNKLEEIRLDVSNLDLNQYPTQSLSKLNLKQKNNDLNVKEKLLWLFQAITAIVVIACFFLLFARITNLFVYNYENKDNINSKPQIRVIYELNPLYFYDSNNDGFGDLHGVAVKLDYLTKELNIDCILLKNIQEKINFNKEFIDFGAIDERLGTLKDLENLVKHARKHSIKIFIEFNLNSLKNMKNLALSVIKTWINRNYTDGLYLKHIEMLNEKDILFEIKKMSKQNDIYLVSDYGTGLDTDFVRVEFTSEILLNTIYRNENPFEVLTNGRKTCITWSVTFEKENNRSTIKALYGLLSSLPGSFAIRQGDELEFSNNLNQIYRWNDFENLRGFSIDRESLLDDNSEYNDGLDVPKAKDDVNSLFNQMKIINSMNRLEDTDTRIQIQNRVVRINRQGHLTLINFSNEDIKLEDYINLKDKNTSRIAFNSNFIFAKNNSNLFEPIEPFNFVVIDFFK